MELEWIESAPHGAVGPRTVPARSLRGHGVPAALLPAGRPGAGILLAACRPGGRLRGADAARSARGPAGPAGVRGGAVARALRPGGAPRTRVARAAAARGGRGAGGLESGARGA